MGNTNWEFFWDFISGINLGIEWAETEEEEAWIIDFFIVRFAWIKNKY